METVLCKVAETEIAFKWVPMLILLWKTFSSLWLILHQNSKNNIMYVVIMFMASNIWFVTVFFKVSWRYMVVRFNSAINRSGSL